MTCPECEALRQRVEELEQERDGWFLTAKETNEHLAAAEAKLARVEDVIREVRAEYTGPTAGVADAALACDEILARIRGEK